MLLFLSKLIDWLEQLESKLNMNKIKNTLEIKNARLIGTLFLLAFLLYGIGRNLFENEFFIHKYIGAALILTNSIAVILIGLYLRKTIIHHHLWSGNIYLFSRVVEAIGLASILLSINPSINMSLEIGYFIAMLALGIGSIPMCYIFFEHQILPKWFAIWGLVGYIFLAIGFLFELFGKEWSMYFLILGGLWELTFAIWIIIKSKRINTN